MAAKKSKTSTKKKAMTSKSKAKSVGNKIKSKAGSASIVKKAKSVLKAVVKGAAAGALKGAVEAGGKETGLTNETKMLSGQKASGAKIAPVKKTSTKEVPARKASKTKKKK
jgi:hypothetical protein